MSAGWMKKYLACLALAAAAAGCAPPEVRVHHVLPGALPLGDSPRLAAGRFAVTAGPKDHFADVLAEKLSKRLAAASLAAVPANGPAAAVVDGTIAIRTRDERGRRVIRRMVLPARTLRDEEVPTLVRTADVQVTFRLRRRGDGESLGAADVRRSYSSATDPRVRGELGLGRPDDPDAVPPRQQVIGELLDQCAEGFVRLVSPVVIDERVRFRRPARPADARAIEAVRNGKRWAWESFQAAADARPNDADAQFNAALAAEITGRPAEAERYYAAAWAASGKKDLQARRGLKRIRRVIRARQAAPRQPATSRPAVSG
ncbi:MAG: hypothetical protein J7M21_00355 [Planctomycetes bacterium]|nr:hypothetical protein [Planctomycetota bacterium]